MVTVHPAASASSPGGCSIRQLRARTPDIRSTACRSTAAAVYRLIRAGPYGEGRASTSRGRSSVRTARMARSSTEGGGSIGSADIRCTIRFSRAASSLRAPWFAVSCFPTNLARTYASLAADAEALA